MATSESDCTKELLDAKREKDDGYNKEPSNHQELVSRSRG